VGELECNDVIEWFVRTLKEQCLYLASLPEPRSARRIIPAFIEHYDTECIERLSYRTLAAPYAGRERPESLPARRREAR